MELVLGGARSGKSAYALRQAEAFNKTPIYLATAAAHDDEMQERIALHRAERSDHWQTVEETIYLADALSAVDQPGNIIVVDCLTLWLTNCLLDADDSCWKKQKTSLMQQLDIMQAKVILVSNEVGQGIIPLGELSRRFVDESGRLHQELASMADRVTLLVAGIPLSVKPPD